MSSRLAGLLLVVTLGSALSGCIGTLEQTQATRTTTDDGGDGPVGSIALKDCREEIGIFPVPASAVEPYLPDGFEPAASTPPEVHQGEDPTGQTATLLLVGMDCESPRPASFLFPFVPVVPPADERVDGVYYHAVALPCVADEATSELLRSWHVLCEAGDVGIETRADAPAGAAWDLTADDGNATVTMEGAAPASRSPAGAEWIRLFHAAEGKLCARSDARVEPHEHWQFGPMVVDVQGDPAFHVPDSPGLASLGMPGISLTVTPVPAPDGTGGDLPDACPDTANP